LILQDLGDAGLYAHSMTPYVKQDNEEKGYHKGLAGSCCVTQFQVAHLPRSAQAAGAIKAETQV